MKKIVTAAQAKEIDRYSIEELGMPGLVLMERAALKFVEHVRRKLENEDGFRMAGKILETMPENRIKEGLGEKNVTFRGKLLVVCGSGNNGGDGMAAARMLFEMGYDCSVYLAGNPERMTESAAIQWNLLKKLSVPIVAEFCPEPGTILIDALFGVGLSREVTGHYAELIQKMNGFRCFAVDLPSGLNADNGQGMVCIKEGRMTAVTAEMTVTFGPVKAGLVLGNGRQYAGEVYSEDIGFPAKAVGRSNSGRYLEDSDIPRLLPERSVDSNKGSYGRVLVFAGSETMLGASYYAGKAAYRVGAGLVEIVTCKRNIPALAGMLPAAVYTPVEELTVPEKKINMASAVVLGPGLGISERAERIVGEVLKICSREGIPLVVDADGLNILSGHEEWYGLLKKHMVLTPHMKEMSRLCGMEISKIKADIIGTAKAFASRYGTILLLKDSRSVITDGNDYFVNMSGNHGMAVGGSGDVLSGILGGLLAQQGNIRDKLQETESGFSRNINILDMAGLAAYLHGRAGDAAKEQGNAWSMMADDVLEALKTVLGNCGEIPVHKIKVNA